MHVCPEGRPSSGCRLGNGPALPPGCVLRLSLSPGQPPDSPPHYRAQGWGSPRAAVPDRQRGTRLGTGRNKLYSVFYRWGNTFNTSLCKCRIAKYRARK